MESSPIQGHRDFHGPQALNQKRFRKILKENFHTGKELEKYILPNESPAQILSATQDEKKGLLMISNQRVLFVAILFEGLHIQDFRFQEITTATSRAKLLTLISRYGELRFWLSTQDAKTVQEVIWQNVRRATIAATGSVLFREENNITSNILIEILDPSKGWPFTAKQMKIESFRDISGILKFRMDIPGEEIITYLDGSAYRKYGGKSQVYQVVCYHQFKNLTVRDPELLLALNCGPWMDSYFGINHLKQLTLASPFPIFESSPIMVTQQQLAMNIALIGNKVREFRDHFNVRALEYQNETNINNGRREGSGISSTNTKREASFSWANFFSIADSVISIVDTLTDDD